jgi:bacteriophage N4 adsorption protein B
MGAAEAAVLIAARATHELALFSAVGILIAGLDDLLIDLIWIARAGWRRLFIYTRHLRADAAAVSEQADGRVAVFVPAWREAEVIGPMLATAVTRWGSAAYRIYVGCYSNDPASIAAVHAIASQTDRIRPVLNPRAGPTTKGDNLNAMWRAMLDDEAREGRPFDAVALHDAEDVVHPAEIGIYAALCRRYDLVQLPVLPLIERERGWWARAISSTYADEFSEANGMLS